jgi:hypothetical protein
MRTAVLASGSIHVVPAEIAAAGTTRLCAQRITMMTATSASTMSGAFSVREAGTGHLPGAHGMS